jgi:hypothetical protein
MNVVLALLSVKSLLVFSIEDIKSEKGIVVFRH